jgi:queuosine precursor transporter
MIYIAILSYAASMLAANLTVAAFGPVIAPINAFFLIGLDLALRDWLHVRLEMWQMAALILGTSVVTYALNSAAQQIAIASAISFCVAAVADWLVFANMPGSWFRRSAISNVAGAAVDSLLFPTLAFGALLPGIVLAQFAAKVIGSTLWAWALSRRADSRPYHAVRPTD